MALEGKGERARDCSFSTTSIKERPCEDTQAGSSLQAGENSHQEPDPAATVILGLSSLQNCEKTNFCCSSHLVYSILSSGQPEKTKMHCTSLSFLYWLTSCVSKEIQGAVCSKLPDKSNWLTFTQYRKEPQGHKTLINQWPNLWGQAALWTGLTSQQKN